MDLKQLEERVTAAETNGVCKINIVHDTGNEGIWACFVTPADKEIYHGDKRGTFEVFLMNGALIGGPSWGAKLKVKTNGGDLRPNILVADVIKQMEAAVKSGDYPTPDKFQQDDSPS